MVASRPTRAERRRFGRQIQQQPTVPWPSNLHAIAVTEADAPAWLKSAVATAWGRAAPGTLAGDVGVLVIPPPPASRCGWGVVPLPNLAELRRAATGQTTVAEGLLEAWRANSEHAGPAPAPPSRGVLTSHPDPATGGGVSTGSRVGSDSMIATKEPIAHG